jgi:hypothetical protein
MLSAFSCFPHFHAFRIFMLSAIIFTGTSFSPDGLMAQQPFEQWLSPHAVQAHYKQGRSTADADGNVYQAGATLNDHGLYEALLTKIDRNGALQWTYSYSAPSAGQAWFTDVQLLPGGKLALSGVELNASETASSSLAAMVDPALGVANWIDSYSYPGSVYNGAASVSADSSHIYIAGLSHNWTTLSDMLVLKYDLDGNIEWSRKEDFFGLQDGAVKLIYHAGAVLVTGAVQYNPTSWHYGTLKYDASDGSIVESHVSGSSMSSIDTARDMVLDADGNIYITGSESTATQGVNMYTVQSSVPSLQLLWDHSYNYSGSHDDIAHGIALSPTGQVLITGYTDYGGGHTQFTSVMYSNAGNRAGQPWLRHQCTGRYGPCGDHRCPGPCVHQRQLLQREQPGCENHQVQPRRHLAVGDRLQRHPQWRRHRAGHGTRR